MLEIGCGNGRVLISLPPGAVGVDYSWNMLLEARRRVPAALLVAAEGERLPFRKGAFATVVAVNSLHNQPDPSEWLEEIRRLAPSRLIVDLRNSLNPVVAYKTRKYRSAMEKARVFYRSYSLSGFRILLSAHGFSIARILRIHRPVVDAGHGFRLRNLLSHCLSRLPAMTMSFCLEARPLEAPPLEVSPWP